jgi:acyl-CoA synthetase (AMP-forming)/AMP-acid ligase II
MVIRGRNLHPQDIEDTVGRSHPALRPSGGAAFSVNVASEERLVVVQEVDNRRELDMNSVIGAIRQAIAEEHDVQVFSISLVKAGNIPKTTSGKVQRGVCRDSFLNAALAMVGEWRAFLEPAA